MTDTPEQTAEKIAARGREALISRLRPAFEEAAAAHSDVLKLGPEQIETMVQRAADRADGLQWRRALAGIATEELGISLGEALSHPAVIRAHEICGAPSYEDSLAELGPIGTRAGTSISRPVAEPAAPATPAVPEPAPDAVEETPTADEPAPDAVEETPTADEPTPEPEGPSEPLDEAAAVGPAPDAVEETPEAVEEPVAADAEPGLGEEPVAADAAPTVIRQREQMVSDTDDVLPGWDEPAAEPGLEAAPLDSTSPAGEDAGAEPPAHEALEADAGGAEASAEETTGTDAAANGAAEGATQLDWQEHPLTDPDAADLHGTEPAAAGETTFEDFGSSLDREPAPSETLDQATAQYNFEDFEEEFYEDGLRIAVIHLGGIANLEPAESDIELLMSSDGLDIIRGGNDVLGRLEWEQVKALEVPLPRGRRRVRRPGPTHLVIRTARGDASFEVPDVTPAELRQHLAPVIDDHVRRP